MQQSNNLLNFYVRYLVYDVHGIKIRETARSTGKYKFATTSQTPFPSSGITPPDWTYKIRAEANVKKAVIIAVVRIATSDPGESSNGLDCKPDSHRARSVELERA